MMLRKYLCHKNVLFKSSNRESFIKRFSSILSNFFQFSFVVVILILLFVNNKTEGSLSTSKSQLKHERNGRCKFQSSDNYIRDSWRFKAIPLYWNNIIMMILNYFSYLQLDKISKRCLSRKKLQHWASRIWWRRGLLHVWGM